MGHNFAASQRGLSLVELMVAMLIGLFLMAAVVQVVVNSKSAFISEREISVLQESARYAAEFVGREVRMAGYQGCAMGSASVANTVIGGASSWSLNGPGLQGFEHEAGAGSFPTDFGTVWPGTDALVIRRGDTTDLSISSHNANAASIHFDANHDIKQGEIIVIANTDCTQVGIFQMSNTNNNNTISVVAHNTGNGASPGNCTKKLGGSFQCAGSSEPASGAVSFSYPKGSSVMRMRATAFYVAQSSMSASVPALYARRLAATGGGATSIAEELVAGVENLQILYGIDSNDDGVADRYAKANNTLLNTSDKWKQVVAVRLSMRMRSITPVYSDNVAYGVFDGIGGTDGSDRFLRKTITTTIQVRNHGGPE